MTPRNLTVTDYPRHIEPVGFVFQFAQNTHVKISVSDLSHLFEVRSECCSAIMLWRLEILERLGKAN